MFGNLINAFNVNVQVGTEANYIKQQVAKIKLYKQNIAYDLAQANENNTIVTCRNIICNTLSKLPLLILKDGKEYREHRLWEVVHNSPNGYSTTNTFISTMTNHLFGSDGQSGNCYAIINKKDGFVKNMQILQPSAYVTHELNTEDKLIFKFKYKINDNIIEKTVDNEDLIRIILPSNDGIRGLDIIQAMQQQLSIVFQANTVMNSYYANGMHTDKVIKTIQGVDSKEYIQGQNAYNESNSGIYDSGRIPTLPFGTEIQELNMQFADAQLNESIKQQSIAICVMMGVPLWMLGLEEMKYKSIEESLMAFHSQTIQPLAKIWKEELTRKLLTPTERKEGITIEFNTKAMMQMDAITRANYYSTLIKSKVMNANTAASIEGYEEYEGGEFHWGQAQDQPIELVVKDGEYKPITNGTTLNVNSNQ